MLQQPHNIQTAELFMSCPQCTHMWADYADVVMAHMWQKNQMALAMLLEDAPRCQRLAAAVESIVQRRSTMLAQIRTHQQSHGEEYLPATECRTAAPEIHAQ